MILAIDDSLLRACACDMHAKNRCQRSKRDGCKIEAVRKPPKSYATTEAGRRRIYARRRPPTCRQPEFTPGSTRLTSVGRHAPPPSPLRPARSSQMWAQTDTHSPNIRPTAALRTLSLAEMSNCWAGRPLGSLRGSSPDGANAGYARGKGLARTGPPDWIQTPRIAARLSLET